MKLLLSLIIIVTLCNCSENNNNNSGYKKQSDLPVTGNQIKKKDSKSGLISDYY